MPEYKWPLERSRTAGIVFPLGHRSGPTGQTEIQFQLIDLSRGCLTSTERFFALGKADKLQGSATGRINIFVNLRMSPYPFLTE